VFTSAQPPDHGVYQLLYACQKTTDQQGANESGQEKLRKKPPGVITETARMQTCFDEIVFRKKE
jgi:hypothetical protein